MLITRTYGSDMLKNRLFISMNVFNNLAIADWPVMPFIPFAAK